MNYCLIKVVVSVINGVGGEGVESYGLETGDRGDAPWAEDRRTKGQEAGEVELQAGWSSQVHSFCVLRGAAELTGHQQHPHIHMPT